MTTVNIYDGFDSLPDAYQALFHDASSRLGLFTSLGWFTNLAQTVFKNRKKIRIYGVEKNQECLTPCLALPMSFEEKNEEFFRVRRLMPVGNYYTSFFSPVVAGDGESLGSGLAALASAIANESPRWDIVDFHPMAPGTPIFDGLLRALRQSGMLVQRYFCFGNWYLELNGRSFSEYFDSLPSKLRNTLTRKSKQLRAANRLRIALILGPDDVDEAIEMFETIYNSSWKKPEPFPEFIPGLIRMCARNGWLRMGVAYVDGQPAAAQIWIVSNGTAYIYKLAYAEQYSKLSVGSILTATLMEHVIDVDKVQEVDYLTGDDAYKRDWMSHRRIREGIMAFNLRTGLGIILACRHLGGRMIKKWTSALGARLVPRNAFSPSVR